MINFSLLTDREPIMIHLKYFFSFFIIFFIVGCTESPNDTSAIEESPALDTDSPEYAAIVFRQALLQVIAYKSGSVRNMADGEIAIDEEKFAKDANDLDAAVNMLVDGFIEGSSRDSYPNSFASPDIWSNWDDFLEKANNLKTATAEVNQLAMTGGFVAAQTAAQELGSNCGACHRPYRIRND